MIQNRAALHHLLPSRETGLPGLARFLDGVECHDGRIRLFFGQAEDHSVQPAGLEEIRDISGGIMVATKGRTASFPLSLTDGSAITLPISPNEVQVFADKRVLMLMRVAETPEQLAQGILWHRTSHGAEAALVINRCPGDQGAGFAARLSELLTDMTLRVVDLALPSGAPDQGPETHPYLAPDAPGKDRMEVPAADPWASPLAEGILYELMKWRWLALARSVVSLEACDILPAPRPVSGPNAQPPNAAPPNVPPNEPEKTVFEHTEEHGILLLSGRRIYPWRIRPGRDAEFGDHITRMFDSPRGAIRWACAPSKVGLEKTWRQTRIAYTTPQAGLIFYRAMALRVNAPLGLPLAPKTSLIADDRLYALSQALGARPVRPPESRLKAAPSPATSGKRVAIVTTMKNEGPFILEWLAYHRVIGVTDFLIYTNDCTDGTDTMLQMLERKGICQWRENPFKGSDLKPQHAALQAAESEPLMRDCDWGICMDVDEFIDIKIGNGTLPDLFEAMEQALPGANMIALTWRLFGNAETHEYKDEYLLSQFPRCAPQIIRKPHQAWGFKTLFRNIEIYKKLGVHRPKGLKPDLWDQVRWLNGSGKPLPREMYRNGWRSTLETYGYDWVQLNHYAVRSAESFLVKRDRGRVNHVDRDQGLNYWFRMNHNAETDHSIQRMLPALEAEMTKMMADPEIRAAHEYSVKCHREKIAELRATENYTNFYAELTGDRMQALCRLQAHFGSAVFNAGPGVIPEDLHKRVLPPDFFFTVEYDGEQQH